MVMLSSFKYLPYANAKEAILLCKFASAFFNDFLIWFKSGEALSATVKEFVMTAEDIYNEETPEEEIEEDGEESED